MQREGEQIHGIHGYEDFDPSAPPPFRLGDIRAAFPKHHLIKNPWRAVSYVSSGHGSFSDNCTLNTIVGQILHSSILVPYHGWRISHMTHHQNHGHVEKDESWVPWYRSPGKEGSHFSPYSDLFSPKERKLVMISTACWILVTLLLGHLCFLIGTIQILKLYGVPHWIFTARFDGVTYLHHNGYKQKLPWYRGKEWSYLRGGHKTVDRDYGLFNNIHHDIGTHVIHHLFPQIPHCHLVEATEAAKAVLGRYHREP
ncbi:hypothetical protein SLEP1_g15888 [Rubroshorea leprosula]|uniref:Fatty acid desaturase domain-containing protein n=1 Tax=Rubroshorea leprosula TaxID=152421 RepID=A0AAV5IZE4_9ROSI|nr:hypothetical protein SLEP1_g15888 [Rubroshorea leprosula]